MRKDIQGLRAIAVLAVLLYHFWPSRLTGGYVGVDIFFVISGFLITSHLIRTPPTSFRKLTDFWARRIKRLLPAAALVLLVTLAAGLIFLPSTMTSRLMRETASAAVYVENWTLASSQTDYLSKEDASSPIQHFWSLSVEEQFYLVWPLLIGAAFLLSARWRKDTKIFLWVGLSSLFAASLAYSVYLTSHNPAAAYFVTPTRMWELALGGLIALLTTYELKRVGSRASVILAWVGLVMIGAAILTFTQSTPFPGYTALLPTLGTAMVILAASDDIKWSPRRLLGWRLSQFFGDISYSLYLWHWPVLIIYPYILGVTPQASLKVLLIVFAVALAAGMKYYFEDPIRYHRINSRKMVTYSYGLASVALVAVLSLGILQYQTTSQAHALARIRNNLQSDSRCLGAAAMIHKDCTAMGKKLITPPEFAKSDKPDVYADGCWSNRPFIAHKICTYGDKKSTIRVALVGNSHAGYWHPPISKTVEKNHWRLDTYLVSECYTVDKKLNFSGIAQLQNNCQSWNQWAVSTIAKKHYDLVIMSDATHEPLVGVPEEQQNSVAQAAYNKTIELFTHAREKVLVIHDDPDGIKNIPDCIASHNNDPSKCNNPRAEAVKPDPLYEAAQQNVSDLVSTLNITNKICGPTICYTTVGGVIVYFDYGHLTKSFAATLYPEVSKAMTAALGE